jgi:D-alanyl-D-alanine carboxypeptidase
MAAWGPSEFADARVQHRSTHAHSRVHHRRHRHRRHLLPVADNAPTAELVFDANSGLILALANPDQRVYPASLTKMMTLYLTFRAVQEGWVHLNDPVLVSAHAASAPPTKLGLRPGQYVTVNELISGAVTESANDAARALAEHLDAQHGRELVQMLRADLAAAQADDAADAVTDPPSAEDAADRAAEVADARALADSIIADGSEQDFARLMTLQARLLGMDDTVYRNASGLPDMEQVTTAPDMAMLAYAIVNLPSNFYSYFSLQHFDFNGRDHHNHNLRFLTTYDGADGIKTGYTQSGGFNVVDSARHGERRLIAIVMGRQSLATREADVRALLDAGFSQTGVVSTVSSINEDELAVGRTLDFPNLRATARLAPQREASIATPATVGGSSAAMQ